MNSAMRVSSDVRVTAVKLEHRLDSPFVATSRPRLSWIVENAPRDWRQVEAHARLDGEEVVTLAGADNVLREWPFAALSDDRPHTIEVRVSDASGQISTWSEPREVRCAAVDDWTADFIGLAEPTRPAQPVLLSHAFTVGQNVVGAVLHYSAFGIAEISIDGTAVDDSVLGPGWTSYDSRVLRDSIDVLPVVSLGKTHELLIKLTGGWYTEEYGFGPAAARVYGEQPAVALELHLAYDDGRREVIRTDGSWMATGDWQILSSGIYAGETVDLRRHPAAAGPVAIVDTDVMPVPRTLEPVRRIEELAPTVVERLPNGDYRLDFGQNLVGRLRLSVEGPSGREIVVRHAEVLEDGELAYRPLRRATATDRYVLDGNAHALEPLGTFHGFRYAQISGWPGRPRSVFGARCRASQ